MILVGRLQKVLTLFFFAEWRRAVLHGKKPIKLTVLEELMLICPLPNPKYLVVTRKSVPKMQQSLVGTSKETLVLTKVIMIPTVLHIYIFVVPVTRKARLLPIHPKIVANQKTTRALQKCSAKY